MMWGVAWSGASPTARSSWSLGYGPDKGQANHARFDLPEFNALYELQRVLPDGPERDAVIDADEADPASPTCPTRCTCTASRPTWRSPGSSATTATCSCATSGATSTSTGRDARGALTDVKRCATCDLARRAALVRPARSRCRAAGDGAGGAGAAAEGAALRVRVAETSFDPAQVNDLYSRTLTPHIFEALYNYDHLARPVKIKPLTADGMPRGLGRLPHLDHQLRPGIYFADDPAFKGKKRELVAQDYVYAFKRFADPANKSPLWSGIESEGCVGLAELRQAALEDKQALRLRPRDRGRARARPLHAAVQAGASRARASSRRLAAGDLLGAVAREVVEFYGDEIEAHPVGTGPFRLKQWRRSSLIVLERNPSFRELSLRRRAGRRRCRGPGAAGALQGPRACRWSTRSRSRSSRRSSRAGCRS